MTLAEQKSVPPMAVVQFSTRPEGFETTLSSADLQAEQPSPLSVRKVAQQTLDDGTVSSTTSLRTAEETWFEDYCGDSKGSSNPESSPAPSPVESQRKTIDLPRPVRRHRRNNSAVPRLQSSHGELPPLPPKKHPASPASSASSAAAGKAPLRQHSLSWDSAMESPPAPPITTRPGHKRTSSAPLTILSKPTPMEILVSQLERMQQQFGKLDSRVGPVWNMIGNSHVRNGNSGAALKAYKEAIKCEPGEHLADSYCNMGTVLFTLNKLDEAVHSFHKALELHEQSVDTEMGESSRSLKIASVQYQIGLAQTLRKRYDEAWIALKSSCKIRAAVLGEKHTDMAKSLDAIGKVYLLRNSYKAALACHEEALAIKKGAPGGERAKARGILVSLQNIAAVHKASNNLDAAIFAYGAVLGAQKKQLESGPPSAKTEAAETLVILADLFKESDMASKANVYLEEADQLLERMGFSRGSPLRQAVLGRMST